MINDFFTGKITNHMGESLSDILYINDSDLENRHDIIQWMFPLHEPSAYSETAPILTQQDCDNITQEAQTTMRNVLQRFRDFLGVHDGFKNIVLILLLICLNVLKEMHLLMKS